MACCRHYLVRFWVKGAIRIQRKLCTLDSTAPLRQSTNQYLSENFAFFFNVTLPSIMAQINAQFAKKLKFWSVWAIRIHMCTYCNNCFYKWINPLIFRISLDFKYFQRLFTWCSGLKLSLYIYVWLRTNSRALQISSQTPFIQVSFWNFMNLLLHEVLSCLKPYLIRVLQ